MKRCSKCNNELIESARFCNICGTPTAEAPATPTPSASDEPEAPVKTGDVEETGEPVVLKRTIKPEIRRVRPPRTSQGVSGSLVPSETAVATGTPDGSADKVDSDALATKAAIDEEKSAPRSSKPPVKLKTTIDFTSTKTETGDDKEKSAPLEDAPAKTDRVKEGEEVPTAQLPDLPVSASPKAPVAESPEPVKDAPTDATTESPGPAKATPMAAAPEQEKTVPLPPPPKKAAPVPPVTQEKTVPLPPPNGGVSRAPGIIRPIVSSASLRQNTPVPPGQTPPNPMSPLPRMPDTPPLPAEKPRPTENARLHRLPNTPPAGALPQDAQRAAAGPQSAPVPRRQPAAPDNQPVGPQNRFNNGAPQTPRPALHDMPTDYLEDGHSNGNGAGNTATRQELPLMSPESFAYTTKAAQHWRNSWRDLQNAEAGPAQDVSKGQAEVPAPLANRKDSFLRMRAIRSKQNQDGGDKNFGFWVTLFLMICLIGGLAGYIVYSYLPNTSGAVRLSQSAGAPQPTFTVAREVKAIINRGQSLRAQGSHFGANDPIQFMLDSTTPVLTASGKALSVLSDSQGAFSVTILAGKNWAIGAHVISATDTRANLSAYLDIQVNPSGSPVPLNNNPYLDFTLNGQAIEQLSFTAQLGQSTPATQRITFTNISGSKMQWTAAASTKQNPTWLSIVDNDFAGQLDISEPHTMGIMVNPAGLNVTGKKPYTGQIVFTINGNTQLTLKVQLTIINATPEMVFSPNPLVATANADGTCQAGATLTFINLGTTVIVWSAKADLANNIWFVNNQGAKTQSGQLNQSGLDGDTFVVNLVCSGVKAGTSYTVHVFANGIGYTEIVQIV